MTEAERIAKGLSGPQRIDLLRDYPIAAGRPISASFYAWNMVKVRRRFWLFGAWLIYLTPLGLAVRKVLEANQGDG